MNESELFPIHQGNDYPYWGINISLDNSEANKIIAILIEKIYENDQKCFDLIKINSTFIFSVNELELIKNLVELFNQFQRELKKNNTSCAFNYEKCKIDDNFFITLNELTAEFFLEIILNPVFLQENLLYEKQEIIDFEVICISCKEKIRKLVIKLAKLYINSKFIKNIRDFYGISSIKEDISEIFPIFNQISIKCKKKEILSIKSPVLESYSIFNNYYEVKIVKEDFNIYYKIKKKMDKNILKSFLDLQEYIIKHLFLQYNGKHNSLEKKIDYMHKIIKKYIEKHNNKFEINQIKQISFFLVLEILNIPKIFPILLDQYVEEVFLDFIGENLYLNHQKFDRLETLIKLNKKEIEAIKNHIILESNLPLDHENPSLMYVINNRFFHCRFSIDIKPLHWKDISLDIRKMNKKMFTLLDLINLNTLNDEIACFLILCILLKVNITIVGEVNSGKTTLLNALDLCVPKKNRKIYVEETIESLDLSNHSFHQLKFETKKNLDSKKSNSKEIIKLLHRSGDYIILGEILTKDDTEAFFHCLSAGLIGFQTTHCGSIKSLLNRWLIHYEIKENCLNDLGIIVLIKKIGIKRKIIQVCEISLIEQNIQILDFFKYKPDKNKNLWIQKNDLFNSKIFNKIKEIILIDENDLKLAKNVVLKFINEKNKFSIEKVIKELLPIKEFLGVI